MKISKAGLFLIIIGCLAAGIGAKMVYDFKNPDEIDVKAKLYVWQEIGNLDHVRTTAHIDIYVNGQLKFGTIEPGVEDWLNSHDIEQKGVMIPSRQEGDFFIYRYYIQLDETPIDLIKVGPLGED